MRNEQLSVTLVGESITRILQLFERYAQTRIQFSDKITIEIIHYNRFYIWKALFLNTIFFNNIEKCVHLLRYVAHQNQYGLGV